MAAVAVALFHGSIGGRPAPTRVLLTNLTRVGTHIVAVDEHGAVLLSDDDGKTWRQTSRDAASAMLSAVALGGAPSGWVGLLAH
ncbi:hypothetical protein CFB46_19815 [Burkholderia sp. HI2761]|nr:hypothetical protein CFB46_19815 [Burkholderia sp. HI2761]